MLIFSTTCLATLLTAELRTVRMEGQTISFKKLVNVLTISNLSVTDLSSGGPSLKFTHTETDPDSRIYLIIFKNIY